MKETIIFTCTQCPKIFATRSNLKRHMENPNIHNIPYTRSRDQKRWQGHSKKISSKAETTERNNRMRKWRAENRDKNKRNDLRCRVYRLARQKYGENDSEEKKEFINQEINRRLGRRLLLERKEEEEMKSLNELPFYSAPLHKIELPSIHHLNSKRNSTEPSAYNITSNISQPPSPSSTTTTSSPTTIASALHSPIEIHSTQTLPPMQSFLTTSPLL